MGSYYGQFELDRILYETFFKKNEKKGVGFFVECGAFDGLTECTCKFFEESLGWTGMNIEPLPYAYEKLVKNRPNCINLNCALSNREKREIFVQPIHPVHGTHFGNGSINHAEFHRKQLDNDGCTYQSFEVICHCFDDLAKIHLDESQEIDLFVLDVEGHELLALMGILRLPDHQLPKVFCIEHTIVGLDELKEMLSEKYTFHSFSAHNSFFVRK